jgi:hypothetical protein
MPIDPDNDPNEAYEVVPAKVEPHGPPAGWWTVLCNGIPVRHFSQHRKDDAERYARDPAWREQLGRSQMAHDRKPT